MPVVQVIKNKIVELPDRSTIIGPGGVQHPWNIVANWSDDELAKIKVYRVARAEAPEGKRIVPDTYPKYVWNDKTGRIDQVIELEDIPNRPEPHIELKAAPAKMARKMTMADQRAEAYAAIDEAYVQGLPVTNPVILFDNERKAAEATAFLADKAKTPNMSKYPYLAAAVEAKVDGPNATSIARSWVKTAESTRNIHAKADAKRVLARKAIAEAKTFDEFQAIVNGFKG